MQGLLDLIMNKTRLPHIIEEIQLLGHNKSLFSDLFDRLDQDKDGMLNAAELRAMFRKLFGDPVSTEHLLHFENRYLMQYGKNGCLPKEQFFEILADYEKAHGCTFKDDIVEFYQHFAPDDDSKMSAMALCQSIATTVPYEVRAKLHHLKDYLIRNSKSASDITLENFKAAICEMFNTANQLVITKSQAEASAEAASTVKHPFYRALMIERVNKYEAGLARAQAAVRTLWQMVNQEMMDAVGQMAPAAASDTML